MPKLKEPSIDDHKPDCEWLMWWYEEKTSVSATGKLFPLNKGPGCTCGQWKR